MTTDALTPSANDRQVAGDHYKFGVQHWDMLIDLGYGPEYFIGQITKYLCRWRKKNGLRDLAKARHFTEKLAELVEQRRVVLFHHGMSEAHMREIATRHVEKHLLAFYDANDCKAAERQVMTVVAFATTAAQLREAAEAIAVMERTEQDRMDAEPPVSAGFEFIAYTDDSSSIVWQQKSTGKVQTLAVDQPPSKANWN